MTLAGTLLRALRDGRCAAPRPLLRKAAQAEESRQATQAAMQQQDAIAQMSKTNPNCKVTM